MRPRKLKLSKLKSFYEKEDENVLSLLTSRHSITIDDEFELKMGTGTIDMDTDSSKIDYQLTVGNCLGFSPLLPNARSDHLFCFHLDLQQPYREFRGKNGMLGFDPAGKMLYIGRCRNEDVFLAMAPNDFLQDHYVPTRAGYATGKSVMSTQHYRMIVALVINFLSHVPELAFQNLHQGAYGQSLDSEAPNFKRFTNVL